MEKDRTATGTGGGEKERRSFLLSLLTLGSLGAGYGLFGLISGRFLYPARGIAKTAKMFVGFTDKVPPRESIQFTSPSGESYLRPHSFFTERSPLASCMRLPGPTALATQTNGGDTALKFGKTHVLAFDTGTIRRWCSCRSWSAHHRFDALPGRTL